MRDTIRMCLFGAFCMMLAGCQSSWDAKTVFKGRVSELTGTVSLYSHQSKNWTPARIGNPVAPGDSVRIDAESKAVITFNDNTVALDENTKVGIEELANQAGERTVKVHATYGDILSDINKLAKTNAYEVHTPTAVAAVRGTHFHVHFDLAARVTNVNVLEGTVAVLNPFLMGIPVLIPGGFFTMIPFGLVPVGPQPLQGWHLGKMKRLLGDRRMNIYKGKFKFSDDDMRFEFKGKGGKGSSKTGFGFGIKGDLFDINIKAQEKKHDGGHGGQGSQKKHKGKDK